MPFNKNVVEMVAYRAAYVCSNPECNKLTVGPTLTDPSLKILIGEAAHIIGEKPLAARHESLPLDQLNDISNAIWLCSSCHTEIDKAGGVDYNKLLLREWKLKHENHIADVLKTHKSPLPLVIRNTINAKVARDIVDIIDQHGAFYQQVAHENPDYVIIAIKRVRLQLQGSIRDINKDSRLREIGNTMIQACREYMNETSIDSSLWQSYLDILRRRIGIQLKRLRDEYGIHINGPSHLILPK